MAGTKEIKRRIKSVKNTKKITKAMELVAASKMKKAISKTLASRVYASYSWDFLISLSEGIEEMNHLLFNKDNGGEKDLIILITSNRGLCGGYDSQIIKKTILKLKEIETVDKVDIITVGKKGDNAMRRVGQNIIASFNNIPDNINLKDIIPISDYAINEFNKNNYKRIYISYTDFVSALLQKPKIKKILPISKEGIKKTLEENFLENLPETKKKVPYLFEGNTKELLDDLAEKLIRMQIYQMFLESNASEQSSRMVAMKNASEAAGGMIDDLTLIFNKARQAGITREISEISGGMASMN